MHAEDLRGRVAMLVLVTLALTAACGSDLQVDGATPRLGQPRPTAEPPRDAAAAATGGGAATNAPRPGTSSASSAASSQPSASSASPASPSSPATPDLAALVEAAVPIEGSLADEDGLFARLAPADIVLLGEPSHGTHEVYEARAALSSRLIDEAGFAGVVIEADWPDAWRVDRYVRGMSDDTSAAHALGEFDEFPAWMWRNEPFADFVEWLRQRNASLPYEERAGVYGMDVYSLADSLASVSPEVGRFDRRIADRLERRYRCAGPTGADTAHAAGPSCAEHVRAALADAAAVAAAVPASDAMGADRAFSALQNARVVVNGRSYFLGEESAGELPWNIRDAHMADTLWALREHLIRTGRSGRLVVWAHNSHIGDARETEVAQRGQLNLGQLVRESEAIESVLVGFSTYAGTVTAADSWGGDQQLMDVVPALPESHAGVLHGAALLSSPDFFVLLGDEAPSALHAERQERYIGVIYLPQSELMSHYLSARLAEEYDVVVHLDRTSGVRALDNAGAE